jgi:glutathione S-transferase
MRFLHHFHGKYALFCRSVARHRRGMDLYLLPMSCSFAAHVACLEAGLAPNLLRVDRKTKRLDDGREFAAIAPQGAVPVVSLPDGGVLTESVAVLQYIADQAPDRQLAPAWGTPERYRLIEWLNFTTSELHKKHLWMIFSSKTTDEMKAFARATVTPVLDHVARHLASREYLVGDRFTVADAYMFWALFVAPHGGISLDAHPALRAYVERIRARPTVAAALAYEGPLFARESAASNAPRSQATA